MTDATTDAVVDPPTRPRITESYSGYTPPFHVKVTVSRMLDSVPPNFLNGLDEVVLTNFSGLARERRRSVTKSRKRKVRVSRAAGLYHQAWNGNPAWIEIFVDNALEHWQRSFWMRRWLYIPAIRTVLIGRVLFHEIGHHIHATIRPEHREREDVADDWKDILARDYFRIRHPWICLVTRIFRPLTSRYVREKAEDLYRKGLISRAEFAKSLNKK